MSRVVKSTDVNLKKDMFIIETKRVEIPEDSGAPAPSGGDMTLSAVRREAEKIIKQANIDAEILLRDIRTQGEERRKEIYQKAQEEGYRSGYGMGMEECMAMKEEAQRTLDEARQYKNDTYAALEDQMIKLITDIVDKLLVASIEINPQIILVLIRQGMAETTITSNVNLRVSQADYGNVTAARTELESYISGDFSIEIVRDNALSQGDCIIETAFGNIDVSLDRQFTELKNDLIYISAGKKMG